jgi:hypothetical protein
MKHGPSFPESISQYGSWNCGTFFMLTSRYYFRITAILSPLHSFYPEEFIMPGKYDVISFVRYFKASIQQIQLYFQKKNLYVAFYSLKPGIIHPPGREKS